jgi:hypothetical protein
VPLPILGDCSGDTAKQVFTFAVCTCSSFVHSGTLTTDSFDSRSGRRTFGGGSVGTNGEYSSSGSGNDLGGSLWAAANSRLGGHVIAGDLRVGQGLTVTSSSRVRGSAEVDGSVTAAELLIDGQLRIPPGATATGVTAASTVEAVVNVPAPCRCEETVDVAGIARSFATDNDNANIGLDPGALTASGPVSVRLPCGRYFVTGLGSDDAELTLRVDGRVVLAVDGSLAGSGNLTIELGPDAELDLFVSGAFDWTGPLAIGDARRPAALRIYLGEGLSYSGEAELAGNLYAPNGVFTAATRTELWGALFAQRIELSGTLIVHYDQAILDVEGCAPPAADCTDSCGCANPTPTCRGGKCGRCEKEADCCPPLHCADGECVPDLLIR